jgi:hypothetical protein
MDRVESAAPVDSPTPTMVLLLGEGCGPHRGSVAEDEVLVFEAFGSGVHTGIGGVNSGVDV